MGSWSFSLQHNTEGFQKIFSPKYCLCSLHGGDFTHLPTEHHTYILYHPGCGPNSTSGAYLHCTLSNCWYYIAITITRALLGVNTVFRFSLWSIESPVCTCTWVNMMFRTQEALDHLSSVAKCIMKTENLLYCQEQRFSLCSCLIYFKNIGHTLMKDNAPWLCLLRELQTRLSQPAERMQMGIPMRERSCTAQWTEWTAAASLVLARLTICDLCHLQGLVKALIHAWATQAIWGRQLS